MTCTIQILQTRHIMAESISLKERLDTAAATDLCEALSNMPASSKVVLDASAVTHFGAQTLQVILSAADTFSKQGGSVTCSGITDRAEGQLAAMGIASSDLMEMSNEP